MRIPVSSDWFGYHFFYNSDVTPNDPDAALGYSFTVDAENWTISAEVFYYLNYFGSTVQIRAMRIDAPVWECTPEAQAASNGIVCTYDEVRQRGDLTVGKSGVALGMKPQDFSTRDMIELISTTNDGVFYTFVWRSSRYAPFDGSTVRVRYVTAPSDILSETVGIILNFRYHGSANHFYAEITLDANDNSAFWTIVDGLLQHEEMEAGSNNYLVGGSFGDWILKIWRRLLVLLFCLNLLAFIMWLCFLPSSPSAHAMFSMSR
jgi:hypothetical protein